MKDVPITFEHNGVKYSGYFSEMHGAVNNVWHLIIDRFYCGTLSLSHDKWVFDANDASAELKPLADFFEDYLTAWYE